MSTVAHSVESNKNGLIATTYIKEGNNLPDGKSKAREDSFEVSILKRLSKVAIVEELDKSVTPDYIIEKLGLVGKEANLVQNSTTFDANRFLVGEINQKIHQWNIEDEVGDSKFAGESKEMEMIEDRSNIDVDVTKGMVLILPMKDWGNDGGVYAKKQVSDIERRSEIKVVLKYKKASEEEYILSDFATVKLSDLTYGFEGVGKLGKNIGKLKHLMAYTPSGMEALNFEMLYISLCRFHNEIEPEIVSSKRLDFKDIYRSLVKEVYDLVDKGEKDIVGEDYYKLEETELKRIAKKTGYDLEELVVQLKERGFLETDKDKKSRRQKTVTRNGKKGKYYCVLTSKRFNELCERKADKLSLPSDKFDECLQAYQILKGSIKPQLEEKKEEKNEKNKEEKEEKNKGKQQRKKKIKGMPDIDVFLAQF